MSELVAPALLSEALVGEVVVLVLAVGLVWVVFRELARVALKVLVPAGVLVGVALWLGWLDQTMVGNTLASVGDGVMGGIRWAADWVVSMTSSG